MVVKKNQKSNFLAKMAQKETRKQISGEDTDSKDDKIIEEPGGSSIETSESIEVKEEVVVVQTETSESKEQNETKATSDNKEKPESEAPKSRNKRTKTQHQEKKKGIPFDDGVRINKTVSKGLNILANMRDTSKQQIIHDLLVKELKKEKQILSQFIDFNDF